MAQLVAAGSIVYFVKFVAAANEYDVFPDDEYGKVFETSFSTTECRHKMASVIRAFEGNKVNVFALCKCHSIIFG